MSLYHQYRTVRLTLRDIVPSKAVETYRDNEYNNNSVLILNRLIFSLTQFYPIFILPWLLANNITLAAVVPVDAAPSSDHGMLFFFSVVFHHRSRVCPRHGVWGCRGQASDEEEVLSRGRGRGGGGGRGAQLPFLPPGFRLSERS